MAITLGGLLQIKIGMVYEIFLHVVIERVGWQHITMENFDLGFVGAKLKGLIKINV